MRRVVLIVCGMLGAMSSACELDDAAVNDFLNDMVINVGNNGCENGCDGDTDADTDMDTDADTDMDTDMDTDTDTDSDTDTDTDTDADGDADSEVGNDCLKGSVTIENELDVERYRAYRCITGNLAILNEGLSMVDWPNLEAVGGSYLDIQNSDVDTLEGLGNLVSFNGAMMIANNPHLPYCEVCDLLAQLGDSKVSVYVDRNKVDACWTGSALQCP